MNCSKKECEVCMLGECAERAGRAQTSGGREGVV